MRTISVLTGTVVAFFLLSVGVAAPSQAQLLQQVTVTGSVTATALSSVVVTFPLIVSELHGTVQVMGTANLPGMSGYYLELRPLNNDSSIPTDEVPWIPATLPSSTPVQAGVLANWDTIRVSDGLYELRLTVTRVNAPSTYYVVSPLRIDNAQFLTLTPRSPLFTLTPTLVQTSLLLNGIVLNPAEPTCGSTFTVTVNVNNPTNAVTAAGAVYVQDIDLGSGMVTATGSGTIPSLNPGANYVVAVPLTVSLYYSQAHEVHVNIAGSQIAAGYTLAQGSCNGPTTTLQPTAIGSTQIPSATSAAPSATVTGGSTQIPSATSAVPSAPPLTTATAVPTTPTLVATFTAVATE